MPGTLKVDTHIHTSHSKDSRASPGDVVRRALELGFDAIAVTDHGTVRGAIEAEGAAAGTGMLVIPGQEVCTSEGEVIVLGLRSDIPGGMPALETMKRAREAGGFVIVPHPYDIMRRGIGNSMEACTGYIDAIEAFNARTMFGRFNDKARAFAEEHGIPVVTGSDSHFLEEMGGTYFLVGARKETGAILSAIKAGRVETVTGKQSMNTAIRRGLMKIRTYF